MINLKQKLFLHARYINLDHAQASGIPAASFIGNSSIHKFLNIIFHGYNRLKNIAY